MKLFKKDVYRVQAWKYVDKYYIKIYKSDTYMSIYLNEDSLLKFLDVFSDITPTEYIQTTDANDGSVHIILKGAIQNIEYEHCKTRFSEDFKLQYDAECRVTELKSKDWNDVVCDKVDKKCL